MLKDLNFIYLVLFTIYYRYSNIKYIEFNLVSLFEY